ncbi:MAG: hypothetical protein E7448_01250 [Ruminococcaceae bacterium]|nr:hypothetical protein [Oscillospiraceae bacterium]
MSDMTIKILSGPERIRRRPAVIFGSEDITGVEYMLQSLLEIWLEEAKEGYIRNLTLTGYADGSVGLQDDGRGLWLGEDDTVWKHLFCEMSYIPRGISPPRRKIFEPPAPDYIDHDNFYIHAATCAAEYMDVHAIRDGISYKLHFEKGENIDGLSRDFTAKTSGTALRIKPDREVFTETVLSSSWLSERAQMLAVLVPGITAIFREETESGFLESSWCYPKGIVDFLQDIHTQCTATPVYTDALEAEGQERYDRPRYKAKLQFGLRFTAEPGFVRCYHNFRELTYGGRHLDIMLKEIVDSVHRHISRRLTKEDVLERLQLVVITEAGESEWMDCHGNQIGNTVLRDMASDLIRNDVGYFIKQNKTYLEALFYQG